MLLEKMYHELIEAETSVNACNCFADTMCIFEECRKQSDYNVKAVCNLSSAQKEMERFMRALLMVDILKNDLKSAEAVLYIPYYMDVRVCVKVENSLEESVLTKGYSVMVRTSFGEMSEFVYSLLQSIPAEVNPVKIVYSHIEDCYRNIHDMLAMHGVDTMKEGLTRELLREYKINDLLNISTFHAIEGVRASFYEEENLCNLGEAQA